MPQRGTIYTAKISDASNITWSDGSNFDGFVRLGLVVPKYGGTTDTAFLSSQNLTPAVQIPLNTIFPVTDGHIDQQTAVLQNRSISPPNSQYVAWWYDTSSHLIAGPSTQFTVSSTPITLPVATLTVPAIGSTIPPSKA